MDAAPIPLPSLLSWALTAFTVELDNEFERRMPRRATGRGSWTASLVMWYNAMQFVGEDGVRVGALSPLARTTTTLHGLTRWGYVTVTPDSPAKSRASEWLIRATPAGRKAQEVWRVLPNVIENRWLERFGREEIARLREALQTLLGESERPLPDCLPNLGPGLFVQPPIPSAAEPPPMAAESELRLALPVLFARALLSFALEFERKTFTALAVSANVLRVLTRAGVRVSDLPKLSGVSKQAIRMALGVLQKADLVIVETPEGCRTKIARLTSAGQEEQQCSQERLRFVEQCWRGRFGNDAIGQLRQPLERLAGADFGPQSPLWDGLEPDSDGWRASVPRPSTLPHFPMILLHRGGYPDGS